jgi:glutamate carboxypeptidase
MSLSNAPRIDAKEILAGITEWVEVESPSTDGAAVNRLVTKVATQLAQIGARVERIPGREGYGDHIRARSPWGGEGPGIVVLGHLDTVWPNGTLGRRPVTIEGDKVFGPGIYDMKAGDHIAFYAYRHLVRQGRETKLPVTFLYVSEEEVGSPTSRELIEETARNAKYVLVMEPGRPGGAVVTSRKAVGRFDLKVTGVSAHAGAAHENGRSALAELARQILALEAMTDYARGITVNVGVASGGTPGFANVIPDHAEAEIDFRAPDMASSEEMVRRVRALAPLGPEVALEITGGVNRPPFEKHEGVRRLYEHAKSCAESLGQGLPEVATGGGSDGNFTAALGIPTLDGLGVTGGGAHADHEFAETATMVDRTRLLTALIAAIRSER